MATPPLTTAGGTSPLLRISKVSENALSTDEIIPYLTLNITL